MINFKFKRRLAVALALALSVTFVVAEGSITVPDTVTVIGYAAYRNRKDARLVVIPESVERIDKNAFLNCPNLISVDFDDSYNWFATQDYNNWRHKSMGTRVDLTDPSTNASILRSGKYYLYKVLEE